MTTTLARRCGALGTVLRRRRPSPARAPRAERAGRRKPSAATVHPRLVGVDPSKTAMSARCGRVPRCDRTRLVCTGAFQRAPAMHVLVRHLLWARIAPHAEDASQGGGTRASPTGAPHRSGSSGERCRRSRVVIVQADNTVTSRHQRCQQTGAGVRVHPPAAVDMISLPASGAQPRSTARPGCSHFAFAAARALRPMSPPGGGHDSVEVEVAAAVGPSPGAGGQSARAR
jgi:hypothetical protein